MDNTKIDFVVTWLDSNDPEWQMDYSRYKGDDSQADTGRARFREWDLFHFWFRAVEQYAPWVNKVFLVTNGTFPKWINPSHPKLVLVKHEDYIPHELLPTFNSRTIELYMHKIPGLSEHFVYFNDDCYLNQPVKPSYYFRKGLPCDRNKETVFNVARYTPEDRYNTFLSLLASVSVVNGHFRRPAVISKSLCRWFGPHLGFSGVLISLLVTCYRFERFVGFKTRHVEQPYLKTIFEDAWKAEPELLRSSCTRFREESSLTIYFFRYWQFASNKFYPVNLHGINKIQIRKENVHRMAEALHNKKTKSLCLNDCHFCTDNDFAPIQRVLKEEFEKKFPVKSAYEL